MADTGDSNALSRFAYISQDEINRLLLEKDYANTRKNTDGTIKVLKSYFRDKGWPEDFELYEKSELDQALDLVKFYCWSQ